MAAPRAQTIVFARWPQTDEELHAFVEAVWGVRIPRLQVCPGHVAPFEAFAHAYFARSSVTVWKASRGFGGKSKLLSTLALTELVTFGAQIKVLGGSGAQSANIVEHGRAAWRHPYAPRRLLAREPTSYDTYLTNGGHLEALMASQTSVRGPHPQRLRLDEVDEMSVPILDAAMGQTMAAPRIPAQTVLSSTHHHPDGTMTEVLRRAKAKGWPVHEWCYRETLQPHGWLAPEEVERKRNEVTATQWQAEYELEEPSGEGRAIMPEAVEAMFDPALGTVAGEAGRTYEFEPPEARGRYAHGADWARDLHWSVFWTLRTDVAPMRLVCFRRDGRRPWPEIVEAFNQQVRRYPGAAAHDATGLGGVIDDLIRVQATAVELVGRTRSDLFNDYVVAIERGELKAPRVEYAYGEHKYVRTQDLYGQARDAHPPDTFVAGALAYFAHREALKRPRVIGYSRGR